MSRYGVNRGLLRSWLEEQCGCYAMTHVGIENIVDMAPGFVAASQLNEQSFKRRVSEALALGYTPFDLASVMLRLSRPQEEVLRFVFRSEDQVFQFCPSFPGRVVIDYQTVPLSVIEALENRRMIAVHGDTIGVTALGLLYLSFRGEDVWTLAP